MITRIITANGKKGIVVVKEDGRVYKIIAEENKNQLMIHSDYL